MTYTVHGTAASGNCHKVRIALDILGAPYEWREIDVLKGESRTPEFLAMNPNGKVPVLAIDDATFLPESNAILWYLGEGTTLVPDDRLGARPRAAVDVLRAVQPRAGDRGGALHPLLPEAQRRPAPAGAEEAGRRRPRRDGAASRDARLVRRRRD